MKLATEVTFTFNNKFCKQIDGCTVGQPIYINMVKLEIDAVRPLKRLLYSRYVDDIYNRQVGKMDVIKFFMHATTTMKALN